ncbi:DEAD/DEAH box helicase [Vineibacter terrae]|uniref:DEAD/DEAH box helicase n=1 Tax=Vineibacter terrae TaxID=2586908 RepID=UPI0015B4A6AE|nr:DEAD/DEAH box helicase [Vineibacter terrae]
MRFKDVELRYKRAETTVPDHAERFRLRLLAHALENWNQLTGSLDRLDVDPLPHQIQLVHRILSSGNYNWLIADDVGLGKTIEVGLLLAALKRKGQARRVLIISPAGITRPWQDEMKYKFDQIYEVYGLDFRIADPDHWKLHDHVIVSLDLAKRDEHMRLLGQSGGWDVVVFDEAHKLSRQASGERTQRYRLAEMLRQSADVFLLLSGTPHQGYVDRFLALLELVRPDLKREIHTVEANPEIVGEMILRNRKRDVTDVDGNFIFKGTQVHRVPVPPSAATVEFQDRLRGYLRRGYKAGETGGAAGRAVGFVMTTYRKLASSSIAAIEQALRLRLERLTDAAPAHSSDGSSVEEWDEDFAEGGDHQDNLGGSISATSAREFFEYERDLIAQLLEHAAGVRRSDEKLQLFLKQVVEPVVTQGKKLLVFTEYRATQSYLKEALSRYAPGTDGVVLINGSMKLAEKLEAIGHFNGPARFLVSTEAGGEGFNLHQSCHVMVNYDLPWNPARLAQRIGRLYRYGQRETVIVFNLHARDSFDNAAIDLMLGRVLQIVQDMAPVGSEYNERLYAEILGDILERIDFASVLEAARSMEIERTRDQIDEAIRRAQTAQDLQQEIFAHVSGYDPNALRGTLGFTMGHVGLFIRGMLPLVGATTTAMLHDGALLEIRLPEALRGQFPEFAQRTSVRITTDRRLAQRLKDAVLLDFEAPFFRYLIETAQSYGFNGQYASAACPLGVEGALGVFKLRWQNDQGEPLTEEFLPLFVAGDGHVQKNPSFLAEWLTSPLRSAPVPHTERKRRATTYAALVKEADRQLGAAATRFKHPNGLVHLAVADCGYARTRE